MTAYNKKNTLNIYVMLFSMNVYFMLVYICINGLQKRLFL